MELLELYEADKLEGVLNKKDIKKGDTVLVKKSTGFYDRVHKFEFCTVISSNTSSFSVALDGKEYRISKSSMTDTSTSSSILSIKAIKDQRDLRRLVLPRVTYFAKQQISKAIDCKNYDVVRFWVDIIENEDIARATEILKKYS